jgi:hypothetical protein
VLGVFAFRHETYKTSFQVKIATAAAFLGNADTRFLGYGKINILGHAQSRLGEVLFDDKGI